jgi:hypothetical protein
LTISNRNCAELEDIEAWYPSSKSEFRFCTKVALVIWKGGVPVSAVEINLEAFTLPTTSNFSVASSSVPIPTLPVPELIIKIGTLSPL